jgi:predicted MFS family arabinose efflux permease
MTHGMSNHPDPGHRLRLPGWIERYRELPGTVIHLAVGQFLINLVGSAHFFLLNLYLKERGLDDPAIAALGSQRFVAGLFLAIPAGLWLRGRPLRGILVFGSILFPLSALAAIEAVRLSFMPLASLMFLLLGFASLLINVASLPMMLRLVPEEQSSEALSLVFASWAAASVCGGAISTGLHSLGRLDVGGLHLVFNEYTTLLVLTLMAFAAPFFHARLPDPAARKKRASHWLHIPRDDWPLLLKALVPTVCIATGAGLSIQFLNLFFSHVHSLSSKAYAGYGSISNVLVLIGGLVVPEIKRRLGWRGAILGVQGIAVALLIAMGLTELVKAAAWALPFAIGCFILRQPLMSMAGPSTSELTMTYVGEGNRELVSACNGAIWSGAWWLAARTFQVLRAHEVPYWQVFMVTAALYMVGAIAYLSLIRTIERQPGEEKAKALPLDPGNPSEPGRT